MKVKKVVKIDNTSCKVILSKNDADELHTKFFLREYRPKFSGRTASILKERQIQEWNWDEETGACTSLPRAVVAEELKSYVGWECCYFSIKRRNNSNPQKTQYQTYAMNNALRACGEGPGTFVPEVTVWLVNTNVVPAPEDEWLQNILRRSRKRPGTYKTKKWTKKPKSDKLLKKEEKEEILCHDFKKNRYQTQLVKKKFTNYGKTRWRPWDDWRYVKNSKIKSRRFLSGQASVEASNGKVWSKK